MTDESPTTTPADDETAAEAAADAPGTSEVDEAEALARLETLGKALAALDDDTIRTAVDALSENNRNELATNLNLPKATMHLGNALPSLLRRKLRSAPPVRQLTAAFTLSEAVNDETVRALGDRHDDPSRDDLLEVLPPMIDEYGAPLVTVLVAAYAASDAPCQAVMAELLDTDERLAIGDAIPESIGPQAVSGAPVEEIDDAELEAKRDQRKAAKAAKREEAAKKKAAHDAAHAARRAAQRGAKKH